jgi:hypothetical protein
MVRTGIANLPLHGGIVPKWLFKRMMKLSEAIIEVIINEYSNDDFLKRVSDPFWFQSLSCVLGFDWHSSGCTTVTCGVLKEVIKPEEHGFAIVGGKGKASKKTIQQIEEIGGIFNFTDLKIKELQYSSRMSSKVDNTAIQDGYNLYHHVFLFNERGKWVVIQQGLNSDTNYARRYHWLSGFNSFIINPHNSIIGEKIYNVLNMISEDSISSQKTCIDLVCEHPRHLVNDWMSLTRIASQTTLDDYNGFNNHHKNFVCFDMPRSVNWNKIRKIYDFQPKNYEEFLSLNGVGPRTVRALALISELIYGDKPSWEDPVKYSFSVGGKDGVPYPVDRKAMDESIEFIKQGISQAKIGNKEKLKAFERLKSLVTTNVL